MVPTIALTLLILSAIVLGIVYPGRGSGDQRPAGRAGQGASLHRLEHRRHQGGLRGRQGRRSRTTRPRRPRRAGQLQLRRRGVARGPVDRSVGGRAGVRAAAAGPRLLLLPLGAGRRPLHHQQGRDRLGGGRPRARSVNGIPEQSWNNLHTVYTHGYGLVAAYGNRRQSGGEPDWITGGIPPTGSIDQTRATDLLRRVARPARLLGGRGDPERPADRARHPRWWRRATTRSSTPTPARAGSPCPACGASSSTRRSSPTATCCCRTGSTTSPRSSTTGRRRSGCRRRRRG